MSSAQDRLAAEPIDWKAAGLRPIRKPVKKLPEGTANTSKVGISLSENLLRRIDALARRRYPDRKNSRSAYVRDLVRAGLEVEEGEGWELRADEVLHEADAPHDGGGHQDDAPERGEPREGPGGLATGWLHSGLLDD